jgi:RNA-binding protein 5/10
VFQSIAPVKDIRLVPNKMTGGTKDFAFVEFFTIDDTENVFRKVSNGEFKIRGEPITIQYSKSSRN